MACFISMRWLEPVLATFICVLVVLVLSNVVGRYVFGSGITWTDEAARFLFVWLTFLGATLGLARGAHIGMDLVVAALPSGPSTLFRVLALTLMIIFLLVWGWYAVELVLRSMTFKTPALGIPKGYIYAVAPVSAGLMVLVCVHQLVQIINKRETIND